MSQHDLDLRNAEFWSELCGSSLAASLGIREISTQNLRRFDDAYISLYPYLRKYYVHEPLAGRKILEVGLGYGTLGQELAARAGDYYGLDVADGPVEMMCYRLSNMGLDWRGKVQVGSVLDAPYKDGSFDYIYSIGCLHHSGNLGRAVSEVHRLLKTAGKAVIMLYNKKSFRLLIQVPIMGLLGFLSKKDKHGGIDKNIRALYDTDSDGIAAPHTDFVSPSEARQLFRKFSSVKIDIRNFDSYSYRGRMVLKREWLLGNIGRILGLDLYIVVIK